jgi:DNA-binding MarR family transcriptional regulator
MAEPESEHELSGMAAALTTAADELMLVLDRGNDDLRPQVSPVQLRTLLIVEEVGAPTLGTLATRLHTVPSSASRTCDRLQTAGLLLRQIGAEDRREVALVLTSAGRRLLNKLRSARKRELLAVVERMSEPGRTALFEGLREFRRALHGNGVRQGAQRRRDEMPR